MKSRRLRRPLAKRERPVLRMARIARAHGFDLQVWQVRYIQGMLGHISEIDEM